MSWAMQSTRQHPHGREAATMASPLVYDRSGVLLDISALACRIDTIAAQDHDMCRGLLTRDPHQEGLTMLTWCRAYVTTLSRV